MSKPIFSKHFEFYTMLSSYSNFLNQLSISTASGVLTVNEATVKFQDFLLEGISRLKDFK